VPPGQLDFETRGEARRRSFDVAFPRGLFCGSRTSVTAGIHAERMLELGVGTGQTSRRVLDLHPEAELVGIDESAEMLAAVCADLAAADLRVSRLEDPLPEGNFDLHPLPKTSLPRLLLPVL
jgi:SAM-dependent methyltransferase